MRLEVETRRLVDEIGASLGSLAAAVDELAAHQARQLRRTRRILRWTAIGLALDMMLTAVGIVLWVDERHNSEQLKAVNARVSTGALCPLYELFLRSYNPQGPVAQADPAEYDRDFTVIEQGARALGCAHVVRGR